MGQDPHRPCHAADPAGSAGVQRPRYLSASGRDIGMMERKIGQIAMGLVIMVVMAQIPPRVYEGWAPHLYIFLYHLLVAVDAFGAISKGHSAGWIWELSASSRRKSPKSPSR